MKKAFGFLFVLLLCSLLVSCYSMEKLPKGELLNTYPSPNEEHQINIYLCDGGATTDWSIRGELVECQTQISKNIYWCYHEKDADVQWVDNETVMINGRSLNIHSDVYDWRK